MMHLSFWRWTGAHTVPVHIEGVTKLEALADGTLVITSGLGVTEVPMAEIDDVALGMPRTVKTETP